VAVRIRKDGSIVCAAKSDPEEGDTYIDDSLHYRLSVLEKVLIPDKNEIENGLWYWLSECLVCTR